MLAVTRGASGRRSFDLAAYDLGGQGPPLLLAHATGFHSQAWLPVVGRLRSRFHCYAFDQRGHGDSSSPPDGDFDWHLFADDAFAVLDALGLRHPYGAGHSCGGAILLLAEQARPGTFRSLWCYEAVVLPVEPPVGPDPGHELVLRALRRREVFASRRAALDHYSSRPPFDTFDPEALRAYVDHGFDDLDDGTVRLKCRGRDEAEVYRMGSVHHGFVDLPRVRCPVTLVCGAETDAFGPDVIAAQAARLPSARTEVMPGLGHFGPMEDPAVTAAAVVRGLADDRAGHISSASPADPPAQKTDEATT